MYKGGCLCGAIQFEINGPIRDIIHCHCSQCRRAQGTAFATNANVDAKDFRFVCGQDQLSEYVMSDAFSKFFCRHCGSPILGQRHNKPDVVRIRLGTIASDISERPAEHLHVGSKANWDVILDELPQRE